MNIFYQIFICDVVFIGLFYLLGKYAIEKEMKDNWGGEITMEFKKSRKLSKDWTQAHPILDFFQTFAYNLEHTLEKPGDFKREVKWFVQRGKRGYSDRDVWGFDFYLSNVLVNGLKNLQEQAHGVPCGMTGTQAIGLEEDNKHLKKWKKTIGDIIWTFEATQKIQDHNWILVKKEKDREELKKYEKRLNSRKGEGKLSKDIEPIKYHLMTKKEMVKYRKGWKFFQEYYQDLWD